MKIYCSINHNDKDDENAEGDDVGGDGYDNDDGDNYGYDLWGHFVFFLPLRSCFIYFWMVCLSYFITQYVWYLFHL